MGRQKQPVKINQFVGGFVSEANPLNFPPNASSDESNLEIDTDGSRKRRLGFDAEDGYTEIDTAVTRQAGFSIGRSQFRWVNAGNTASNRFLVVQIGNYIGVHNTNTVPLSGNLIFSTLAGTTTYSNTYTYAVVDGTLVIATGEKDVIVLDYDGATVSETTQTLLIRDTFGVEDDDGAGTTLTDAQNVNTRPAILTTEHLYNLRNQTFALPRVEGDADTTNLIDPIAEFYSASTSTVYPSNADSVAEHLLGDPNLASNRTVERFNATSMFKSPVGITEAPQGYFIIDALERGTSRLSEELRLRAENPSLSNSVTTLPTDRTEGGPSVVTQYSGRVWFSGFNGAVFNGDKKSPKLSSYIMFSQIVEDPTQISLCYQKADPTSNIDPDLVETDGGFIKIDGAYDIKALLPTQSSLFIFAENGVWELSGSDRNLFTATSYKVAKLSEEGCVSGNSAVIADNFIFYWSHNGINIINQNKFGDWIVDSASETSIRTFYTDILFESKRNSVGYYDSNLNTVRWLYGINKDEDGFSNELVMNLKYQSFTKNSIANSADIVGPISVSGGKEITSTAISGVTAGGVSVTASMVNVTVSVENEVTNPKESFYCIVTDNTTTLKYTFGGYNNEDWLDWDSFTGVDSAAYLVTGPNTAGEARLRKDVNYISLYFNYTGVDSSSCLLSSQWDWSNSINSNKWSTKRQSYRTRDGLSDISLVKTRNLVRGFGESVSFRFESEAGKDMHLYGWDYNLAAVESE